MRPQLQALVLAGIKKQKQNLPKLRSTVFVFPCPHFSAGERQPKYSGPGFGYNQESEVRTGPIYFLFFSVPQCLRGAKVLFLVIRRACSAKACYSVQF